MSGAGKQAAGTSSSGFGTSTAATEFGGAFLRDDKTGRVLGARKIDPRSLDYQLDANGRALGMRDVRQMVQLALHTEYNSSAVRGFGHKLRSIDRITGNFEKRVLDVLTQALQPLIRAGLIEVLGFSEFRAGDNRNGLPRGAAYGRLRWRDLTTRKEREEFL